MKVTRVIAEQYAKDHGLEPVQIDGIPDGFAFIEPDVTIGENTHIGSYVAIIPLSDNEIIKSPYKDQLLDIYNLCQKK